MTIPTALRRRRRPILPAIAAAAAALALGACGADGGERDATALLERAFAQPIASADVDIDAQLDVDGRADLEDPMRIRATGAYVRSERKLPQLDVELEIGAQGAGQSIQAGMLSTGDRVFLSFGGSHFEQPRAQVARANRRLARDGRDAGGSLGDLGLDAGAWVLDAAIAGEREVGGVATRHVTGTLDVEAVLRDLNALVDRSAGALGDSEQAPRPLGPREIERLAGSVEDPGFDVYVGKRDDIVRRMSLRLDMTVPEDDRERAGGVERATIRLSVELSDVGGDQEVTAPRDSQPISELSRQLGGIDALAGAASLGDLVGGGVAGGTGGGGTPSAGAGSPAEAFERYGDCLEQASPDDGDAISRCADLLR